MNLTKQKTNLFCLLCAFFMLSACGIKGDLYQTPEPANDKSIIVDENLNKKEGAQSPKKEAAEKTDSKSEENK